VHVDPGSPAAKEYALPLNQARQTGQASGRAAGSSGSGSSGPGSSSGEASLFGAGIKPPRGGTGAGGSRARASRPAGGPVTAQPAAATDPAVTRALRESGGGDGSTLALIGGAVAVIVLGGFGGTVLRHSRRPST
jgi:hypothetical protein